jgi:cell division septum initiation protein DivIVA
MSETTSPTLTAVRVVPASTIQDLVDATNSDLAALRAELAELEETIRELEPEIELFEPPAVAPDVEALLAEAQAEAARRLAEAREEAERILTRASAPAVSAPPLPAEEVAEVVAAPDEPVVAPDEPVATAAETPEFWAEMDSAGKARHRRRRSWRALVGPTVEVLIVLAVFIAVLLRLS